MGVAAIGGEWGIAPQAAKIGDGTFTPGSLNWRRYRSPQIDMGPQEIAQPKPQEMSGYYTPTGWYKGGVSFAGSVNMLPRTESVMGFLLYALMGNVSSVSGKDMEGASVTGLYTHIFNYNALNTVPWFAQRLKVPGAVAGDVLSLYGYDCKLNAMQFRMSAAGLLTCRMGLMGRVPKLEEAPSYSWINNLEDDTTIPQACSARVSIGGHLPKVTSMQVDVVNTLSNEFIFGSYFPDDFTTQARGITVRVQTLWDPDIYQLAMTNLTNGTDWNPDPYVAEALGPGDNYGFLLKADAPKPVTGSSPSTNHSFAIRGNRCVWIKDGNPTMSAGGMVAQAYMAQIVTPTNTAQDYAQIVLQNGTNGYLWS